MRLSLRKCTTVATAAVACLALAAPASVAAGESPEAAALACTSTWIPDIDGYDWGAGEVNNPTAPLRPGPYADCGTRETLQDGWSMTIYCYDKNDYDNTWYYVSAYPYWTEGWIYSGNVRMTDGPIERC